MGKLGFISENEKAQEFLNVCNAGGIPNCGHCEKCRRTIMWLLALGKLELFYAVFSIKDIQEHVFKHKMFAYFHRKHVDWPEIYQSLRKQGEIRVVDIVA